MNEVTVLSTAGELTGRVVGHGVVLARRGVVAGTRTATTLGVLAGRATSRAAADAVRARHRVVERAGELSLPSPDAVRRDLAATIAPRRRRRWPWVVLVLGALAGGAVVVASRRSVAPPPAPAPPRVEDVAPAEPRTAEPGTTEPGTTEPAAAEPAAAEPAAADPAVTDPGR
ncbi:hypothetical protein RHODO2019_16385 [Rhodococcus antarcticus]|uniref:Cell wall synthesis protein CwsA n=1 Tax=Rhodococcus antarcticus TaxID=2987751 RepID=A0ABY6P074_9NOCA|nr:hypothetical protein [Rhodococcus antarcticus]UZJ24671.1 hypothetical protein RHODO2019_16385 [Rhodococcus antarcticus]